MAQMVKHQAGPRENTVAVFTQTLNGRVTNVIGSRPAEMNIYGQSLFNPLLGQDSRQTDKNFSKFSVIDVRKSHFKREMFTRTVQSQQQKCDQI